MKSFDYYTVVYDSEIYCCGCLPEGIDIDSDDIQPIFADSEWNYVPCCCKCDTEHDYINLLE